MKLHSKRNEVFLRDGLVYKHVANTDAAAREAGILRALRRRGVAVPQVIRCRENLLVLEYLPGEPLPDVIESGGYDPQALASALCDWFEAFYRALPAGEIRGDVNGRNFLCDGTSICGVDFEERRHGPRARDAGRLAAFIAAYGTMDPERQEKLTVCFTQEFIARFGCRAEEIVEEYEMERVAMQKRRGG